MLKPQNRERGLKQRYSPPTMVEYGAVLALTQGDS
jgi:hypothetical protein